MFFWRSVHLVWCAVQMLLVSSITVFVVQYKSLLRFFVVGKVGVKASPKTVNKNKIHMLKLNLCFLNFFFDAISLMGLWGKKIQLHPNTINNFRHPTLKIIKSLIGKGQLNNM